MHVLQDRGIKNLREAMPKWPARKRSLPGSPLITFIAGPLFLVTQNPYRKNVRETPKTLPTLSINIFLQ
jgi:hypothetical protein